MSDARNFRTVGTQGFATGHHQRWEAALHKWESEFLSKSGRLPSLSERANFVQRWMVTSKNYKTHDEVVSCQLCQDSIAGAVLDGRDPFACPLPVREHLETLGIDVTEKRYARFRGHGMQISKSGVRYRNQDLTPLS